MEEAASGNGNALLSKMRALARRGASLRRESNGAGRIEYSDLRRPAQTLSPEEFLRLLDQGWLRSSGAGQFVISRRGASALRGMLTHPRGPAPALGAASRGPAATPTPVRRGAGTERPGLNIKESPLAWLAQRRDKDGKTMIGATQFEAGERLRLDFERGQMSPRVTASWCPTATASRETRGAPGAGLEMAEAVVGARQRVEAALKAVGPELSGVLLDVCCFLIGLEQAERNGGWPRRAGKVVLQLALAHLARHYGLDRREERGPARVRSWQAPEWSAGGQPPSDNGEPEA